MQNANLVGYFYQNINWMEWRLSRAEILQISHDAMGQNCANMVDFSKLPVKNERPARTWIILLNQLNIIEG